MDQNHSISAHGFDSPAGHASMVPRADRRVPRYTRTALYLDGCNAADLVGFVTVASDFYPKLRAHFEGTGWQARAERL